MFSHDLRTRRCTGRQFRCTPLPAVGFGVSCPMTGTCGLCGREAELCDSHIVPSFVFRWLKDSSATGFLRFTPTLNKRAQEGLRVALLCSTCEQRFSQWEKRFAEEIFSPLNHGRAARFSYGSWLSKYCVSVSWRVLTFLRQDKLSHFSPAMIEAADSALTTWRQVLLDEKPHPGKHQQHMLLLDLVHEHTFSEIPPNLNRYILRTVDIDAACTSREAFIYSKMGRVVLVGFIHIAKPRQWQGSLVHVNHGAIGSQTYTLPDSFRRYLFERARRADGFYEKVSSRQAERISNDYRKNLDRAVSSETWKALDQDVILVGRKRAFGKDSESDQPK